MACRISDAVSAGIDVSLDAFWERGVEFPLLQGRNRLRSRVPARQAVAARVGQLFLSTKNACTKHAFAPHTGLQAVYALILASIHFKQRLSASSTYYSTVWRTP
eukprot:6212372-Pleurochrysis_carterae.AAC.2